jgi:ectoine hydroxylase-related dioxygenase (phytanoyl-CoA dioxygenase family)
MTPTVTPAHLDQFDTRGFFVLERVIPPAHLELLRRLADEAVTARMLGGEVGDAEGEQLMDTRGGRYFIFGLEEERPEIYSALFGDWAVTIIGALTQESVMFHTEFVVKEGGRRDQNTRFGWHQDGGYNTAPNAGGADVPQTPHISIWCALDDMSATNGGLRVLPFERNPIDHPVKFMAPPRPGAKSQPIFEHKRVTTAGENINNLSGDIAGYFGDDPGDIIEVVAGSVVVFSALTLHGSGANSTQAPRRALNIAYTQSGFADAGARKGVEFIKDGQITDEASRLRTTP